MHIILVTKFCVPGKQLHREEHRMDVISLRGYDINGRGSRKNYSICSLIVCVSSDIGVPVHFRRVPPCSFSLCSSVYCLLASSPCVCVVSDRNSNCKSAIRMEKKVSQHQCKPNESPKCRGTSAENILVVSFQFN